MFFEAFKSNGINLDESSSKVIENAFRKNNISIVQLYNEYYMNHIFYGGEAFPVWRTHAYPFTNTMAAFMGCHVEIQDQTGWVYPIIEKGDLYQYDYHDLVIYKDNDWYLLDEKLHLFLAEQFKDSLVSSIWSGASSGDTLAALRGTEQLLMDIMDELEQL